MPRTIIWNNEPCTVHIERYAKPPNTALRLVDADGFPVVTATVNLSMQLDPGWVAIKNYAENAGVLEALVTGGIIDPPRFNVPVGYTTAHVCRLTIALEEDDNR